MSVLSPTVHKVFDVLRRASLSEKVAFLLENEFYERPIF